MVVRSRLSGGSQVGTSTCNWRGRRSAWCRELSGLGPESTRVTQDQYTMSIPWFLYVLFLIP